MDKRNSFLHVVVVFLFLLLWGVGTTATDVSSAYDEVSFTEEAIVVVAARDTDDEREPILNGGYQIV